MFKEKKSVGIRAPVPTEVLFLTSVQREMSHMPKQPEETPWSLKDTSTCHQNSWPAETLAFIISGKRRFLH